LFPFKGLKSIRQLANGGGTSILMYSLSHTIRQSQQFDPGKPLFEIIT
jgi:hypothetical protein